MSKTKKRQSLFTKYYIVIAITIVFGLLVLGTVFSLFLYNYWRDKSVEDLQNNSLTVIQSVEGAFHSDMNKVFDSENEAFVQNILSVFKNTDDTDIYIFSIDGNGVVSSSNNQEKALKTIPKSVNPFLNQKSPADYKVQTEKWSYYGCKVLMVNRPVFVGTNQVASVITVKPYKTFFPYLKDIIRLFALSAIAVLIIAVAVTYYLVYRIEKPIWDLAKATRKIGAGDYSYRVKIDGNDEFTELGEAFNTMAEALATLETSRRNFIANISHELKTPMTTIGGYIDAIIDGTIDRDKQDHYLGIVSAEVKRLSRLVVAMLNLSKIEAQELKIEKKEVDMSQLLFEVMLSFERTIEKNRIEIVGLDKLKSVKANVDKDMIYQVFYNLVDNAVKFTDVGGYIAVHLDNHDGKCIFRIVNQCSGITKEDLSKIFERFYKVDRSRHSDVKGFGLGLYLSKTIVEMHGGQITAMSQEGENCEFLFWVPEK